MEVALISDLHANIEALEATLKDIDAQGIKNIYCLGDLIDYGPNPCEVLDLAIEVTVAKIVVDVVIEVIVAKIVVDQVIEVELLMSV